VKRLQDRLLDFAQDCSGQDMIEYALLAASVAVLTAAAIPYQVVPVMSSIYSKLAVHLSNAS
jgi:Flp pilus assembly pilin Flp